MKHRIVIRHKSEFAQDLDFHKILYQMSFSAYELPEDIINYSIERNDTVYCTLDVEGKIKGVLFTNWSEQPLILANGESLKLIYIGWGVVLPAFQGKGIFRELLEFLRAEVYASTQQIKPPIYLYARTALPPVYSTLKQIFPTLQPEFDGRFSEEILPAVDALWSSWIKPTKKMHPFVLHGAAQYRYSKFQTGPTQQATDQYPVELFKNLSINETNGDRLLMVIPIKV